jgi:Lon protease-like protein
MIEEVRQRNAEFGVVLSGDKGMVNTGCTAGIEKVLKTYDDGRLDILVVGRRRFEIVLLNEEKSYLRGTVEYFDDDESGPAPAEVSQRVMESYRELRTLAGDDAPPPPVPGAAPVSFQLAQIVPDADFRQMLLRTRSEPERMKHLAAFLPAFASLGRRVAHVKHVAPRNGHGERPSSL